MVMLSLLFVFAVGDFPISTAIDHQFFPSVNYVNGQYYAFWEDRRFYGADSTYAVFASRIATDGIVLDPAGKIIYNNLVYYDVNAAFDGTNFLVALEDSC